MAITLNGSTGITTADIAATTLTVNAGYGSNTTAYGVRAWVNFDGTGTVGINASGNVSSITDNGTGIHTVNFTNAMPDTNFVISVTSPMFGYDRTNSVARTTTSCQIGTFAYNGSNTDYDPISVLVVR